MLENKLGDIFNIVGGGTPDRENHEYWGGSIPWVSVKDFKGTEIEISQEFITQKGLENSSARIIPKGNIIVPTRMALGKVAICNVDVAINQDIKGLIAKDNQEINEKFVLYFLMSKQSYFIANGKGATVKGITLDVLSNMKLPVSSVEKQTKLVNILDKAQELIDKRKEQIEACDELVKSLFYDVFGDPIRDKKFEMVSLDCLGSWRSGGTPSRSNKQNFTGKIPWLSSGELNKLYTSDSIEHITEDALKSSAAKLIEKNSLLLGMYDTAALKSTINLEECSCNQAIAFAKLDNNLVNTIFVYFCIQYSKDFYKSQQRGVRQKNLNLTMIKEIKILLPPVELQSDFAEKVEKIEHQKQLFQKSLVELENNFQVLMQRAFKGELF